MQQSKFGLPVTATGSTRLMVNLNESDKRVSEDRKKDDLNKAKDVLEKIAPESTQLISNPIRLGQLTGKKSRLLKINVGSVENK